MSDNGQEPQDNTPAQDATTDNQTFSADYVKELRQEAANYRTKLRDLEAKQAELDQQRTNQEAERLAQAQKWQELAELRTKELETLRTAHTEQQKQINAQRIRSAFTAEAAKRGNIVDIEAAFQLANIGGIEVTEEGKVTGVIQVIDALITDKPFLVANGKMPAPSLDAGAGGGVRPGGKTLSDEQLAMAKKMNVSPEQYLKHLRS